MYCPKCGEVVDDKAIMCPYCKHKLQNIDAGSNVDYYEQKRNIPNHLALSILVTLFCCLPLGIIAIVNSAQVDSQLRAGNIEGARRSSRAAKNMIVWSVSLGAFFIIAYLIVVVMLGFQV